jgi:hypothetical protein
MIFVIHVFYLLLFPLNLLLFRLYLDCFKFGDLMSLNCPKLKDLIRIMVDLNKYKSFVDYKVINRSAFVHN